MIIMPDMLETHESTVTASVVADHPISDSRIAESRQREWGGRRGEGGVLNAVNISIHLHCT